MPRVPASTFRSGLCAEAFRAYITANAVTRSLVRSVGVCDGSVVTANEIATATAAVRIWAADGALHVYSGEAAALTVVRSDGRTVYAASIAPGDTRLALLPVFTWFESITSLIK